MLEEIERLMDKLNFSDFWIYVRNPKTNEKVKAYLYEEILAYLLWSEVVSYAEDKIYINYNDLEDVFISKADLPGLCKAYMTNSHSGVIEWVKANKELRYPNVKSLYER